MTSYASLAAFLAHRYALARAREKTAASESTALAEMNQAVQEILGDEGKFLDQEPADSAARRHRDRAEARLRRELIARGTIAE